MKRLARWRARVRRTAGRHPTAGMRALEYAIAVVAIAAIFTVVIREALLEGANQKTKGLLPIVQDLGLNALSVLIFGAAAWAWFKVRFERSKAVYLQRVRERPAPEEAVAGSAVEALEQAVVAQLTAVRPPRSCLVVAEPMSGAASVAERAALRISDRRLVPVLVDVAQEQATARLPSLARTCFVSQLAGATGDEARAMRLFQRELEKDRVVVVVQGIDAMAEAHSRSLRRSAVAALLQSCLDERIPFVATVPAELAPQIADVAVLRDRPQGVEEQQRDLLRRLTERGIRPTAELETVVRTTLGACDPLSRWGLELAAGVASDRVAEGADPVDAVEAVFAEPDPLRRLLAWMGELALGGAGARNTAAAQALALIGRLAHTRQDLEVPLADVEGGLDPAAVLTVRAGISVLVRRAVLETSETTVRFARSEWFSFAGALGLRLDPDRWSELLEPGVSEATLDALTLALLLDDPGQRSFLTVLTAVRHGRSDHATLEMMVAVIAALQVGGQLDIDAAEVAALDRAWRAAGESARLALVRVLRPHPAVVRFLWARVTPPLHRDNSYRVRRAVCLGLARAGPVAWDELADDWRLVVQRARVTDLSSASRGTRNEDFIRDGAPLASLGWTLPLLVASLAEPQRGAAVALLDAVVAVVTSSADRTGGTLPDVGLEISLAEGIKLASGSAAPLPGQDPVWWSPALALFEHARSWVSCQALLQALAMGSPGNPAVRDVAERTCRNGAGHPFARETAALVRRACEARTGDPRTQVTRRDIWIDDVQALQDGGIDLSDQAHRLLGLSTLLVNLAEGAFERRDEPPVAGCRSGVEAREAALTAHDLPACFARNGRSSAMFDVDCTCGLCLCGPRVRGPQGRRSISRGFAQQAQITCAAEPLAERRLFATSGFRSVWGRPDVVDREVR